MSRQKVFIRAMAVVASLSLLSGCSFSSDTQTGANTIDFNSILSGTYELESYSSRGELMSASVLATKGILPHELTLSIENKDARWGASTFDLMSDLEHGEMSFQSHLDVGYRIDDMDYPTGSATHSVLVENYRDLDTGSQGERGFFADAGAAIRERVRLYTDPTISILVNDDSGNKPHFVPVGNELYFFTDSTKIDADYLKFRKTGELLSEGADDDSE